MGRKHAVHIEGIGAVLVEKSRKARRLNLSFETTELMRVAVPYWLSFKEAKEVILSNSKWIRGYFDKMKAIQREQAELLGDQRELTKEEASAKIISRLEELSRRYGFRYNRVFIREQKTRWGSCSHRKNINLNVKLVKLPERLMDYVILHELVHTRIRNHGKDFWGTLDRIFTDSKKLDSELRRYHIVMM